ncbi:MAG: carboxypeptidase-like regulatory domain-containing protein, partial [Patescibacteria group bacterium]
MLKSVWKLSSIVVLLLVAACGDLKDLKSASLYSVSGAVSGAVSSGITVTLVAGTTTTITTTDANGNFSFAGLTNGGSTITPTAPGYTFSPTSTAVTVNNGNVANINFVTAPVIVPTYSISGAVTGAPNVTVTL